MPIEEGTEPVVRAWGGAVGVPRAREHAIRLKPPPQQWVERQRLYLAMSETWRRQVSVLDALMK